MMINSIDLRAVTIDDISKIVQSNQKAADNNWRQKKKKNFEKKTELVYLSSTAIKTHTRDPILNDDTVRKKTYNLRNTPK